MTKIARTALQFSYTTLFGAFVTFIYLRSGSLLACIAVHSFCNWMGLPRFWGRLEGVVPLIEPLATAQNKDGQRKNRSENRGNRQINALWTVVYYILLVIGAVWFWKMLWVLTKSPAALIDLEK
jgi:prenyl protein peptidase